MAHQIARLPVTLSEKGPPEVFGMGLPKSLIRPWSCDMIVNDLFIIMVCPATFGRGQLNSNGELLPRIFKVAIKYTSFCIFFYNSN